MMWNLGRVLDRAYFNSKYYLSATIHIREPHTIDDLDISAFVTSTDNASFDFAGVSYYFKNYPAMLNAVTYLLNQVKDSKPK